GTGVTATLRAAIGRILENLKDNVDTTLTEGAPLSAPDMTARSGASASSAGTPKLTMKTEAGGRPVSAPAAPPPPPAPAPVTQQQSEESEEDPFGTVAVADEGGVDRAEVEAMLATTREVIASIELALDKARTQERVLRDKLARL
ncbi:MAG: hypothetical protein ACXW3E_15225, partial [Thermoanaerobaculia bacterium]